MITQERLHEILEYDPETGDFTWLVTLSNRNPAGSTAGSLKSNGYVYIRIDKKDYLAHKLAWYYMYGEWVRLDHKNTLNCDNTLSNLRPATSQENNRNQCVRYTNLIGVKGVALRGNKYIARITIDKQSIFLGSFNTLEEATNARQSAAKEYFGEFYNG